MPATIVCRREECPKHLKPMKPLDELPGHVLYICEVCHAARMIDKAICGGTMGAGRTRLDGRREAFGIGADFTKGASR